MDNVNNNEIVDKILQTDLSELDNLKLLYEMAQNMRNRSLALKVRDIADVRIRGMKQNDATMMDWIKQYWLATRLAAQCGDFEAFMLYIEKDRPFESKFYLPRSKALKPIADALQQLLDDELDELFLSQPARTGKTGIIKMFTVYAMALYPELTNLYCAYSGPVAGRFYDGILEIVNDAKTYKLYEVFPDFRVVKTNAERKTIDIGRQKNYPTITCRGIDESLNGECDCQFLQIGDDLLDGIEEAMSVDRCLKKWDKVDNNFLPRGVGSRIKRIWMGTRWSRHDVISIRLDLVENSPDYASLRYKVINIPALNENDESNFDYPCGKGFSTETFRQRRASFERRGDMASWYAQYMGEPIEREGALFAPESMNYYNGVLPDSEPDRIIAYCDPAWGGGDYVAFPIGYQYDGLTYIHDVIFDNRDKYATRPRVVDAIIRNNVTAVTFEKNNGGDGYAEWVDERLREKGRKVNIMTKSASTKVKKENRIIDRAPDIKETFVFRDSGNRSPEYDKFMQNVHAFTILGKNKHDDAPDSLAGLSMMTEQTMVKPKIFKRPF